MDELPTGTVTLLFTGMERSPHLLQRPGSHAGDVLTAPARLAVPLHMQ